LSKLIKAFEMSVKGNNLYLNYSDSNTCEAHCSYHASGQKHTKIGGRYVEWTGGPSQKMERMILSVTPPRKVRDRLGWPIGELDQILPALNRKADMIVLTRELDPSFILGFRIDVIGPYAKQLHYIVGYPILDTQQFSANGLRAEINAFLQA
jgi:hypothetical protein